MAQLAGERYDKSRFKQIPRGEKKKSVTPIFAMSLTTNVLNATSMRTPKVYRNPRIKKKSGDFLGETGKAEEAD